MKAFATVGNKMLAIGAAVGVLVVVLTVTLSHGDSTKPSAPFVTEGSAATLPVQSGRNNDAGVRGDLRNALTAEKVHYVDTQQYTSVNADLLLIEPSLHWNTAGGVLVSVGDVRPGDKNVVCLQEISTSGSILAIADIASGPSAGTFYNRGTCSTNAATLSAWTGW